MTSGHCLVDKQGVYSVKRKEEAQEWSCWCPSPSFLLLHPTSHAQSTALESEAQAYTPRHQHQGTHRQAHTHTHPIQGDSVDKALFSFLI